MQKRRVVFVVGHANWGKSRTLRALTDGNRYQIRIRIGEVDFFIRRMSNDDKPESFYTFIRRIDPVNKPHLIVAFCPEFQERQTMRCIEILHEKGYRQFFWVLRHQYGTPQIVTPDEIAALRQHGHVEVFNEEQAEDTVRARALRAFITARVLA